MAAIKLEARVAALEAEVSQLKARIESSKKPAEPWWDRIAGTFADDPDYEEAMRLGRAWRESFGKKRRKGRKART